MINTLLYRILLAIPTMLGVAVICFMLVQIAPGDPLVSVMPPDASEALRQTLMQAYGFDKPLPLQFIHWLWRALHGDLGMSVATGRPVIDEVMTAVAYSLRLALLATAIGFVLGSLFGFVAGYFRNSVIDRLASVLSVFGVSVPHYWLGMLLVILCSVKFALLPATGGGPIGEVGWQWDWAHLQFMLLPALTLSVIPTGIIARTVRSQVADILSQEFIVGLRARGLNESRIFVHVMKNAAPTALAVMGLQVGYLMGGSILVETVFSWPGTGLLLNTAIFQRDLPCCRAPSGCWRCFSCCSTCWWIFCRPPSTRVLRGADHGGYSNDESGPGRSGPRYPARLLARRAAPPTARPRRGGCGRGDPPAAGPGAVRSVAYRQRSLSNVDVPAPETHRQRRLPAGLG
ncbi:dipeptide transport system permease DppB [Klebsiella pneumoniae]|uniref:Dipeptide transport system permease DppB n=1 Tax=Klebsiella pneumoniae TaxID=573 RepID=A0A4P0XY24_KLEPN|nr:dipeptide transport system permease DppB [Klebsiella pneumoniae]